MATSLKVLVFVAIGIAAAQEDKCLNGDAKDNPVGSCTVLACKAMRGPVDCIGGMFSKKCYCKTGFCPNSDASTCVAEGPAPTPAPTAAPTPAPGAFPVDAAVQVRDSGNTWIAGTVTSDKPKDLVRPTGWSKSFSWAHMQAAPVMYKVGGAVEARDNDAMPWIAGSVTSLKPLEVKLEGQDAAFAYSQVRPKNWQEVAAAVAAAAKKAQGELADGAKTAAVGAASAKKAAGEADAAAKQAVDAATAAEKTAQAAHEKAEADAATAEKTKSDQDAAEKWVSDVGAKHGAADHATQGATKAFEAALKESHDDADASEQAQEAAKQKTQELNADIEKEKKERAEGAAAQKKADDCKAAGDDVCSVANGAAAKAMQEAAESTHKLVVVATGLKNSLDKKATDAAEKAANAAKVAAQKRTFMEQMQYIEKAMTGNLDKNKLVAATAKKAADAAAAAAAASKKVGASTAQAAVDTKKKAVAAEANAKKMDAASIKASSAALDASLKSHAANAAAAKALQFLADGQAQQTYDDNSAFLMVCMFGAAVTMIAIAAWQGARSRHVAMPESVLG